MAYYQKMRYNTSSSCPDLWYPAKKHTSGDCSVDCMVCANCCTFGTVHSMCPSSAGASNGLNASGACTHITQMMARSALLSSMWMTCWQPHPVSLKLEDSRPNWKPLGRSVH